MTNKAKVAKACKITYPTCPVGSSNTATPIGLSCWPGASTRRDAKGQITCPALTTFCRKSDQSSSGDWGWSSTGLPDAPSSGLSAGLIALIIVLVLLGVVAIGGYVYYSRKHSAGTTANIIPGMGSEGLLGAGSTDSAAASDYYAAATHEGQPQTTA